MGGALVANLVPATTPAAVADVVPIDIGSNNERHTGIRDVDLTVRMGKVQTANCADAALQARPNLSAELEAPIGVMWAGIRSNERGRNRRLSP